MLGDPIFLLYPEDASTADPWFRKAFVYLNVDLGTEYLDLVSKWVDLERSTAWESHTKGLGTDNRPSALSSWQKKRYVNPEPKVSDASFVTTFSGDVWKWWRSLQPRWRFLGPAEKPSLPDLKVARSDWTTLDKKGVNGWFGIMVCLKWWGTGLKFCAPKEQVELTEDWLRVMRDISAMLDGLLAHRASKK